MGIFSAGSASVNIVPDFSGAQKAIGRWVAGQRDIKIPVDLDVNKSALVAARAQIAAERPTIHAHVAVDHKDLAKAVDFVTGFSTIGKGLAGLFSPKVLGLTDAIGGGVALAASLSQVAGAAALIPAALSAAAVPLGTILLGTKGIGDAFKAIGTGDIQKMNKALANLAPQAREFVLDMHALAPAMKNLRLDVQNRLFSEMGGAVSNLAKEYLPTLHKGLGDVAVGINDVTGDLIQMLAKRSNVAAFGTVFDNVAKSINASSPGISAFAEAWITLSKVGSVFLPGMAKGFSTITTQFNDWVTKAAATGQLADIIQVALTRIHQLFSLIVSAGKVVFAVFKPAVAAGADLMKILTDLFNGLAKILNAPVAQSALRTFFTSIAQAVSTLRPAILEVVGVLVTDFLPIAGRLAAALAPLAGTILKQIADLIRIISPLIYPTLVNGAVALLSAMAPLIPVFGEIAKALLPPLTMILAKLAPIIGKVATLLGDALAKALTTMAPLLASLGKAFISVVQAVLPLVPPLLNLIQILLPPLVGLVQQILPLFVGLVNVVGPFATFILKAFVSGIQTLLPLIKVLAPIVLAIWSAIKLWTLIQWALNAALTANPIGIVIVAIGALVVAVGLIATHLSFFKNLWNTVWGAVKSFFVDNIWHQGIEPAFKQIGALFDWLGRQFGLIWNQNIKPIFKFFGDAVGVIKEGFRVGVQAITSIWKGLVKALSGPVQVVIDFVWNNGLRSLWNSISHLWHGAPLPPFKIQAASGRMLPDRLARADGGMLPGYTPGRDVHVFYSPTGGVLELSGGEPVLRPEAGRVLGRGWVDSINAAARSGGMAGVRRFLGYGQAYAGGGEVSLGDRGLGFATSGLGQALIGLLVPGGGAVNMLSGYVAKERAITGDRGSSPIFGLAGNFLRGIANALWGAVKSLVGGALKGLAGNLGAGTLASSAPSSQAANVAIVRSWASPYGWQSGAEWSALVSVINRESGFRNTAQNPTSSAYGMFQFLNSTWGAMGGSKTSDPTRQAQLGMKYISQVYGDPLAALRHEQAFGWYDTGGWLPPGWSMAYNGTGRPEAVLNAAERDHLASMLSGASGGATGPGIPTQINGINNSTIQVMDLAELDRMQQRATRRALAKRGITV